MQKVSLEVRGTAQGVLGLGLLGTPGTLVPGTPGTLVPGTLVPTGTHWYLIVPDCT